jgi:hypothetical protein
MAGNSAADSAIVLRFIGSFLLSGLRTASPPMRSPRQIGAPGDRPTKEVRTFRTVTRDLEVLA